MIQTNFKIGDLVTNPEFCEYEPFRLSDEDFKGVTAKNQLWFDNLKACSREKLTVEKLIQEIKNRSIRSLNNDNKCFNSNYWEGYSDALGELLEYIEDNK